MLKSGKRRNDTPPAGCAPSTKPPYCLVKEFGRAAQPCRVDEDFGDISADINTEWSSSIEHPREHHAPRLRNYAIRDQKLGSAAFKVEVFGLPFDVTENDAKVLFSTAGKAGLVRPIMIAFDTDFVSSLTRGSFNGHYSPRRTRKECWSCFCVYEEQRRCRAGSAAARLSNFGWCSVFGRVSRGCLGEHHSTSQTHPAARG